MPTHPAFASKSCDPRCCAVAQPKGFQRALLVLLAFGQRLCTHKQLAASWLARCQTRKVALNGSKNQPPHGLRCRCQPFYAGEGIELPVVVELAEHRKVCEFRADASDGLGFKHEQRAKYDGLENIGVWKQAPNQTGRTVLGVQSNTKPNLHQLVNRNVIMHS